MLFAENVYYTKNIAQFTLNLLYFLTMPPADSGIEPPNAEDIQKIIFFAKFNSPIFPDQIDNFASNSLPIQRTSQYNN